MSRAAGPALPAADRPDGLSTAELAGAAAHAANNISALLDAAVVFLADEAVSPERVRGNALLAVGMARARALAAALVLYAVEPAHVAAAAGMAARPLGHADLERLREDLTREPQLDVASCLPLPPGAFHIDRSLLQSLLTCLIERSRRLAGEHDSVHLSWSAGPSVHHGVVAALTWTFHVHHEGPAAASGATIAHRPSFAEQALVRAAGLLEPLGVALELEPNGPAQLRLAGAPAPGGVGA